MTSIRTLIIDRPDRWEDFGEYIDTRLFVEGCHKKGWKVACLGGSHPEYDACVGELDSSHIKAELAADIKSLSWTLFPEHNNRLANNLLVSSDREMLSAGIDARFQVLFSPTYWDFLRVMGKKRVVMKKDLFSKTYSFFTE